MRLKTSLTEMAKITRQLTLFYFILVKFNIINLLSDFGILCEFALWRKLIFHECCKYLERTIANWYFDISMISETME